MSDEEAFKQWNGNVERGRAARWQAWQAALARGKSGWQDISTAPKDGTLLLGWWAEGMRGKGLPFLLIWSKWLDGSEDGVMCWMDFERAWPREPKFWQPLPSPPATQPQERNDG